MQKKATPPVCVTTINKDKQTNNKQIQRPLFSAGRRAPMDRMHVRKMAPAGNACFLFFYFINIFRIPQRPRPVEGVSLCRRGASNIR